MFTLLIDLCRLGKYRFVNPTRFLQEVLTPFCVYFTHQLADHLNSLLSITNFIFYFIYLKITTKRCPKRKFILVRSEIKTFPKIPELFNE